jgi:hypothetical protein
MGGTLCGVAGLAEDEYGRMIAARLRELFKGGRRAAVSELLWYELADHFGEDLLDRT